MNTSDDIIRIPEPGWRFAVLGSVLLFTMSATTLLISPQYSLPKSLLLSVISGIVGFLLALPTWAHLSLVRTVGVCKKDRKVIISRKYFAYTTSKEEYPFSECKLQKISIFSQRISFRDGSRPVELYLDKNGFSALSAFLSSEAGEQGKQIVADKTKGLSDET